MTESEVALARVDELVRRVLAQVTPPLRFTLAQSDAERESVYRLRYAAVIAHGWARPAEFADGLECDEHDAHALHLIGWEEDAPVATARLVFPSDGRRLPTEEAFGLSVEPRGQVVDAGRFVVAQSHSEMQHRGLCGLLGWSWLTVRARGFAVVCSAFAALPMIRLYRRLGIQTTILADARRYWGEERYPVRWDAAESLPTLRKRWSDVAAVANESSSRQ